VIISASLARPPNPLGERDMVTTMSDQIKSGERLPEIIVACVGGGYLLLGKPADDHD